jgi:carbamoylphosphate synthase large subunit
MRPIYQQSFDLSILSFLLVVNQLIISLGRCGSFKRREDIDQFFLRTEALNLRVVKDVAANSLEETLKAAKKLGYPIVLKGIVEGQVHKTERGLVKLSLRNAGQLKSAYREMLRAKIRPKSFLIQPMLEGDLELIAGVIRDP